MQRYRIVRTGALCAVALALGFHLDGTPRGYDAHQSLAAGANERHQTTTHTSASRHAGADAGPSTRQVVERDLANDGGFRTLGVTQGTVDALSVDDHHVYAAVGAELYVLTADADADVVGVSAPIAKPMHQTVVLDAHVYAAVTGGELFVFDVSQPDRPRAVGRVQLPGRGIETPLTDNGTHLFAGSRWCDESIGPCEPDESGNSGWQYQTWAVDVSDPARPTVRHTLDGVAGSLAASSTHLFLWDERVGLRSYRYEPDSGFEEDWTLPLTDPMYKASIAAHDTSVYLMREGWEAAFLEVIDASRPGDPRVDATIRYDRYVGQVSVFDSRLYVVVDAALYVYDTGRVREGEHVFHQQVSYRDDIVASGPVVFLAASSLVVLNTDMEPFLPSVLGSTNNRRPLDVAVVGDVAFAPQCEDGVVAYDVRGAPVELARYDLGGLCTWHVASDDGLVVATASTYEDPDHTKTTVVVYRDRGEGRLEEAGRLEDYDLGHQAPVIHEGLLYTNSGYDGQLFVTDLRQPEHPRIVASTELLAGVFAEGHRSAEMVVADGHLYAAVMMAGATASGGLVVVDVAQPEVPFVVGSLLGSKVFGIHVHGRHAFLAGRIGVSVVDVSVPHDPHEVGLVALADGSENLYGIGPKLFVAGRYAIAMYDLLSPSEPRLMATASIATRSLSASNERVVAIADGRDLVSIDISGWHEPNWRSMFADTSTAYDIGLAGDTAIAATEIGLQIIDVSSRGHPRVHAETAHGWGASEIQVAGATVHADASWSGGYRIAEISDPHRLTELSYYFPPQPGDSWTRATMTHVEVVSDRAYLAVMLDSRAGVSGRRLEVVDVSDPSAPTYVTDIPLEFDGRGLGSGPMTVHGGTLVIAAYAQLIQVDLSDPDRPRVLAVHDLESNVLASVAAGDLLVLLTDRGLEILDPTDPAGIQHLGVLPFETDSYSEQHLAAGSIGGTPLVSVIAGYRLQLVDLSNPRQPIVVAERAQPHDWTYQSSAVESPFVHVSVANGGYQVWQPISLTERLSHRAFLPYASAR